MEAFGDSLFYLYRKIFITIVALKKCKTKPAPFLCTITANSSTYTINLVGTAEALTDIETKKENWLPMFEDGVNWSGIDDPTLLIIRFKTERYTITFADDGSYTVGNL